MTPKTRLLSIACAAVAFAGLARADDQPLIPYGPIEQPPQKINIVVPPRLTSLTLAALKESQDTGQRVRLTGDLGRIGNEQAIAQLVELLKDSDPLVRAQAATCLKGHAEMAALIDDTSAAVRHAVVLASPTEAVLLKAYDDADPAVRDVALGLSASDKTDAALATHLPSVDAPRQAIICNTLAARKAAATASAIEPLLSADGLAPRIAAIRALAAMGKLSLDQLKPQLAHAHAAVRRTVATALAALPADQRAAPAMALLNDSDLGVRAAAATVLGDVGQLPAVAELLKQFIPEDPELTDATRAALTHIAARDEANTAARPAVDDAAAKLLSAATPMLRADGSYLLGALKSKSQLRDHIALLKDTDWTVVKQAAISLGQIGDAQAAPSLADAAARAAGIKDPTYADWAKTSPVDLMLLRQSAGEQAVLACVGLQYAPVIESVRPVLLSKGGPGPIRTAGVYAIGVLSTPADAAKPLAALIARINDIEESPDVVMEAVKAVGNGKVNSLEDRVVAIQSSEEMTPGKMAATLALDRLHGTHTALEAPPVDQPPVTTITDLSQVAK